MMPSDFETCWRGPWAALKLDPPPELLDELLARYAEPQRHYHTLQHLGECLAGFEREQAHAVRPGEVAIALWFHDAIYDVQGHDNEARSADWARAALQRAGASNVVAQRVHALVMATCHDAGPVDADAQLLVDIDLSILGAPPERFAEYERQIRAEYAHVPPATFEPRRREILGRFLARDPLYLTPGLRAACEAQARVNLRAAIG
ncbi:N-methyl-D-aspartate receptor NMDAR2C subunit [Variovorax sp. J22G21]|uniref:HD domain-containing protein n=1 Tax=Variovorax fucosicus TaxID=3053517 RepID=UPI002577D9D0|nr:MULTISPECIES: N-methyl-D-aspartate receptor NMDAR2C subunit [unclassified Variovorax]MDM0041721.1 N-methyl-D-aspartate receptor NMDAR2C subunit [Variovorax sp. J22R193]MDM0060777.1 N-methyl-D-aspartate receptor NMDAR2C subunit [Variovorax sp. J22G21]